MALKKRYAGTLLDDDILAPFRQDAQAAPQTQAPPPPEAPAPRFTSMADVDWSDASKALSHLMPERKKELEERHKKSARLDALGRAIGSLGGFVSADMGGPVLPAAPGRAREHMDRYEQLILDYEDQKRTHDLMATQEMLKDIRLKDQLESQRDMLKHQEARRDYELGREREFRTADVEAERGFRTETAETEREHRKELAGITHQQRLDEINHRFALDLATRAAAKGEGIAEQGYNIRFHGQDARIPATTAMAVAQRLTAEEYGDIFGYEYGKMEYNDKNLQRMLAKHGEKHLTPRFDQEGKFIEFDLKTSATTPATTRDVGTVMAMVFDQAKKGELSAPDATNVLFAAIDEMVPGMAVKDATILAQSVAEALFADEQMTVETLKSIELPKNIKAQKGVNVNNFWDLLRHYHGELYGTGVGTREPRDMTDAQNRAREFFRQLVRPAGFLPPGGQAGELTDAQRAARGAVFPHSR